jgi:hypothetical protein
VIIRTAGTQLHFITQPDHARMARAVMEACRTLATNPRRAQILHAIGEHDNGWAEADAAPLVDPATGNPVDFVSAPLAVRHGVWPRGVERLARDPWAAALVAQHAIAVYDRYARDPQWTPFFARMASLRDDMLRSSGEDLAALPGDYAFVRLGDLISLAFCAGWTGPLRFADLTVTRSGTHVNVSPDPFGDAVIAIEVQARELRQGPYRDNADLQSAFARAKVVALQGTVSGT